MHEVFEGNKEYLFHAYMIVFKGNLKLDVDNNYRSWLDAPKQ
jgi:hypothetical protein